MQTSTNQNAFSTALTLLGFVVFFGVFFLPAEVGRLMASGDASVESIPALLGARHLWESSIFLGYPLYADPNQQQWYPLAWLASLSRCFNVFAVAPYPIAAFGMWAFVRTATRSSLAGCVSAIVFTLGGFMISHAGHLMITHPAAWAPFVLWSVEIQRRGRDARAVAGGAFAVGLCAVSGQPQLLAFTLAIAMTYAVASARSSRPTPSSFATSVMLTVVLGLGLGCVQLIPEAALAQHTTRASLTMADFLSFEVPASQIATRAVFPYALGVTHFAQYAYSGADLGMFTEETMAVGTVALALAILAFVANGRDRRVFYWLAIAGSALLLATGDATPLPTMTHALPIFGLFRIPGRHAFEWTLAIAILAGYGSAALRAGRGSLRNLAIAFGGVCAIVGAGYAQFVGGSTSSASNVASALSVATPLVAGPLTNGALGIPIMVGIVGFASICVAARFRNVRAVPTVLCLAVAMDTGAFAFAAYWNWAAIEPKALEPAPFIARLADRLAKNDSRLAWLPGNAAGGEAFAPNLPTLWHVPMIGGYSPLVSKRTVDLLGLTPSGGVAVPTSNAVNLDIAGVSIVATSVVADAPVSAGSPFAPNPIHFFFSARHDDAVTHAEFALPRPFAATSIAYVSELGESMDVPQNADVATITVAFSDRTTERHEILAGRDTAEFAFDRPDVRPLMKHARATIYASVGPEHTYVASAPVIAYKPIARIAIRWHYPRAALTVEKLSLVDARTGNAHAFDALASLYADPDHWQPILVDPTVVAFRNLHVLPHAWIAAPVRSDPMVSPGSVLRDGKLLAGTRALVEEDIPGIHTLPASTDRAIVVHDTSTDVVEQATCVRACFVVDRDAFDSDWQADIDGTPTKTYVADIDLRGVAVPAGRHRLHFHFLPTSLILGACIALASVVCLLVLVVAGRQQFWRTSRSEHYVGRP